jgi:hypothetical protein
VSYTAAPSFAPSSNPSAMPSQAPTTPLADESISGLPSLPTTCTGTETAVSFHTNRKSFSVTVLSLPSGATNTFSESSPTGCVDLEQTAVLTYQTRYAGFNYFYNVGGSGPQSRSSTSKTAQVVLP